MIKKVCVYCASSDYSDKVFLDAAYRLGEILAEESITLVYGGGSAGLMGRVAEGALSKNGKVTGIIPKFMYDLEWAHQGLTELLVVDSMCRRKELMMLDTDAAIVLPGGSGTFEELFETITLKRLGVYLSPIILVNLNSFFNPCLQLLENAIKEKFMDERSSAMWKAVSNINEVIDAIKCSEKWNAKARDFATLIKPKD